VSQARVKAARRLGKRAFRDQERKFLAEGPQAVREALRYAPGAVTDLFTTATARGKHADLIAEADKHDVPVHDIADSLMAELAQTVTPQGLLAICGFVDKPLDQVLSSQTRLVAILANVRDPGNAGTVLRAADAAGADAVIFADASVDPYNGKCVRASAGSLFHLPVVVGVRLSETAARLGDSGLTIVAADGGAERTLDDQAVRQALRQNTAWLFGNEAWGLPADLKQHADTTVAIPIYGKAESLNLATAAAICLYASASAHVERSRHAESHGT